MLSFVYDLNSDRKNKKCVDKQTETVICVMVETR